MSKTPLILGELNELVVGLNKLAHNIWWTLGTSEAQELFQELSPRSWQNLYHNAVAVLREVSVYELNVRLQEADFANRVRRVLDNFNSYLNFDPENLGRNSTLPACIKNPVAYFSAEFGFHETLPIAAGGLGILAGDHAKSASDIGLGFAGISLFYREGYFQQAINQDNWQTEYYTLLNPKNLPLEPVLDAKGEPTRPHGGHHHDPGLFPGLAHQRRPATPSYLLDTGTARKIPSISSDLTLRVYGGDTTTRIMQEIVLGIGGIRLLRALGLQPATFIT